MKKYSVPVLLLLLLAVLPGCSTAPVERTAFLPPVKIKIPPDIKKDTTVVAFIQSSEKRINTLSDQLEKIAIQGKLLLNQQDKKLSFLEEMELTRLKVQFVKVMNAMIEELEQIQMNMAKEQKDSLNSTDIKAYRRLAKALKMRLNQLTSKYKDLLSN